MTVSRRGTAEIPCCSSGTCFGFDREGQVGKRGEVRHRWSHAAIYVGKCGGVDAEARVRAFVEADLECGVRAFSIEELEGFVTLACGEREMSAPQEGGVRRNFRAFPCCGSFGP